MTGYVHARVEQGMCAKDVEKMKRIGSAVMDQFKICYGVYIYSFVVVAVA